MRDLGPDPINHGRLATPDAGCRPALPVRHSGESRSPGEAGEGTYRGSLPRALARKDRTI